MVGIFKIIYTENKSFVVHISNFCALVLKRTFFKMLKNFNFVRMLKQYKQKYCGFEEDYHSRCSYLHFNVKLNFHYLMESKYWSDVTILTIK